MDIDIKAKKREYINQKICQVILETLFNKEFNPVRPDFLLYIKNRRLELDCYNKDLKIALEYNGPTHYEIVSHFNTDKDILAYQKEKDLFKIKKCKELNILLLVIMDYDFAGKKIKGKKKFILKVLEDNNIVFTELDKKRLYDTDVEEIVKINQNNLVLNKKAAIAALDIRNYKMLNEEINIISSVRTFDAICYFNHIYKTSLDSLYTHNKEYRWCSLCTREFIQLLIFNKNIELNKNHFLLLEVFKNGNSTCYCNICKKITKYQFNEIPNKCMNCNLPNTVYNEIIFSKEVLNYIENTELKRKYEARNNFITKINNKGFLAISPYYNKKTNIRILCSKKDCNYECDAIPDNITEFNCANCIYEERRISLNKILNEKNIICIDYCNAKFQCLKDTCNYKWNGDMTHIKNKGGGCPKCNGVAKLTKEDYNNVAKNNNGKWIEESLKGSKMITSWQCKNNHIFTKDIQSARTYWNCLECNPPNDYYKLIMEIVDKYIGAKLLTPKEEIIKGISKINLKCPHKEWTAQVRQIAKQKSWNCRTCKKNV